MAGNLRDRLKRIQQVKQTAVRENISRDADISALIGQGWVSAGHLTLRREITTNETMVLPGKMPEAAGIVMPGICGTASYGDLLFFDLETIGLTGAGTVAFLAAFGRLTIAGKAGPNMISARLMITQYLLLDYPGENCFIDALLSEFNRTSAESLTMISYNGKSFDSQILKTRCLMHGFAPPEYRHADLLYPSRRLWKHILPDCSQATIEKTILGIDREDDIPGIMAPDIWFAFLKRGETEPLIKICEHNRMDIAGLAAIFRAMACIAGDPIMMAKKINYDAEALALRWYKNNQATGEALLCHAAARGYPLAQLRYGLVLLKTQQGGEGREWLYRAADKSHPPAVQIAALRALAIDSEHRLNNATEAIECAMQGMELLPPDSSRRKEFERRIQRLKCLKSKR